MATAVDSILNSHQIKKMTDDSLKRIREEIIKNMGDKRRNASMRSVRSLSIMTNETGGALYGLKSFFAMETGRKGGKVPYSFTQIIANWIRAKGITLYNPKGGRPPSVKSVAFLISRQIARRGTALYQKHVRQDIYTNVILSEVDSLARQILLRAGSSITYINQQFAKEANS